jgi:hypothetical protein
MTRRLLTVAHVVFAACLLLGDSCPAADADRSVRILWVGSSSIYYHDQPKVCAEWLTRFCGISAVSELVGRSGTGVHVYLRPEFKPEYGLKTGQRILDKISAEKYDYVVLQVPAEFINGPEGDEHDRSLDIYCRAIRTAGGTPVMYEMGWHRDEKAAEGRRKIFAAAVRNRVTCFAPCSTAWERVRRERPDLDLQNPPDLTHPGTLGCYLNLCCFCAALAGRQPQGLPRELTIWRRLSDEEKLAATDAVATAEFAPYDARLPKWMQRLVVTANRDLLDIEVAEYLQGVAWEEYQRAQQRLARASEQ